MARFSVSPLTLPTGTGSKAESFYDGQAANWPVERRTNAASCRHFTCKKKGAVRTPPRGCRPPLARRAVCSAWATGVFDPSLPASAGWPRSHWAAAGGIIPKSIAAVAVDRALTCSVDRGVFRVFCFGSGVSAIVGVIGSLLVRLASPSRGNLPLPSRHDRKRRRVHEKILDCAWCSLCVRQ